MFITSPFQNYTEYDDVSRIDFRLERIEIDEWPCICPGCGEFINTAKLCLRTAIICQSCKYIITYK